MDTFWKANVNKILVGGCGTQLGLLFSCGTLSLGLFIVLGCTLFSLLAFGVAQKLSPQSTDVELVQALTNIETETPLEIFLPVEQAVEVQPPVAAVASDPRDEEMTIMLAEIESLLNEVEVLRASQTFVPVATPGPMPVPLLMANAGGVDLWSGPGSDYSRVAHLPLGERLEIVGRNYDSTWWLVSVPGGLFAWVSNRNVATFNLNDTIPTVTIPALLTSPSFNNVSGFPESVVPAGTPIPPLNY